MILYLMIFLYKAVIVYKQRKFYYEGYKINTLPFG